MELRKAIVERHATDLGTSYAPSEAIASAGGKQAIFNLICSFINAGDEVILPVPYWVTFYDVINYAGGRPVMVETREEDNFELTAEMVKRALTPKTRLVIVNSPSNPSGAVESPKEMEKILEVTAAHGALLMSDECYSHFVYEGSPFSVGSVRLACGLCNGTGRADCGNGEAAKPQHLQSFINRAKGRRRSAAGTAGVRAANVERVSPPP
jgi:aspartate aminotransferase